MGKRFASQKSESGHSDKGKTLPLASIITPKAEINYSLTPVKGEDYKNLFQNVLLLVDFFKKCNRGMHFLLKGSFGYNYLAFATICYYHN